MSDETKQPDAAQPEANAPESPGGGATIEPQGSAAAMGAETVNPGELKKPQTNETSEPLDLDFILDIPLQVRVEVGRTRMMIQELLSLGKGSVVELNKMLGEPFEVMVNDKLVARGEVVVVNDRFGVRLTDIISPNERVQSLG